MNRLSLRALRGFACDGYCMDTPFGRDDLLKVAQLADRAHSWMPQSGATAHLTPDFGQGKLPKADSNRRE